MPLMPNPISSTLVTEVQAEGVPPDVLVVRGYLGPAYDVLDQARRIVEAYRGALAALFGITEDEVRDGAVAIIDAIRGIDVGPVGNRPPNAPWRLYLTAALDRWVEIEDWAANVVRVFPEIDSNRQESHTVWLRLRRDDNGCEIPYRVVTISDLLTHDGFLTGKLVEDYMTRTESSTVVWDEQQFGPTTGKSSRTNCF